MSEGAGFGEQLRRERLDQHLALDAVSEFTKIPRRSLELLEEGELGLLPAAVIVRGFVRSYARFLGIDADPPLQALADEIERREVASRPPEPLPRAAGDRAVPLHPHERYGVALFVLLLVVVVVAASWLN